MKAIIERIPERLHSTRRAIASALIVGLAACGGDSGGAAGGVDAELAADVSGPEVAPDAARPDSELAGEADAPPSAGEADAAQSTDEADAPTPVEADAAQSTDEALCVATEGRWEAGTCDCQQTPEGARLAASFDPELGCLPDPGRLCGATGGVWEGGACACAQDGATLFYEFDRRRGCGFPDDAELRADILSENLLALVARYASPDQRVWLVDSAGVFMAVEPFDSPAALMARLAPGWDDVSEAAGACEGELIGDALPEVACESDAGMARTGCFLVTTRGDFDRVSMLMKAAVEYEFATWEPAEIARAEADEQHILKVHVASSHRVTLAFRRLAGAWVLVAVDLARYGCSA